MNIPITLADRHLEDTAAVDKYNEDLTSLINLAGIQHYVLDKRTTSHKKVCNIESSCLPDEFNLKLNGKGKLEIKTIH